MKREEIAGADAQAHSPTPAAVEIRGLSKSFGTVAALDDVSLQISEGDFFALLGPSGCGKTTLLRIIGGFENPGAGDVLIGGESVLGRPPYMRPTNMIFQHLALFPHMSVFENIAFGLKMKRQPEVTIKRRVGEALALVRLDGYESRRIDQLSGGQKQRVAMARALVNDPSVLLLDEPLGALDLQLRLRMHGELRRLHSTLGSTFIFVTHDQSEAITLSNRIAVMNQGKVLQVGSPEEIYNAPRTRFVAEFIGHSNFIDCHVIERHAEGRVVVEFLGARVCCQGSGDLKVGERATLCARYERIGLPDEQHASPRAVIPVTVIDRTFMGSAIRLTTRSANDAKLVADVADTGRACSLRVGDKIELAIPEQSVTVLRD